MILRRVAKLSELVGWEEVNPHLARDLATLAVPVVHAVVGSAPAAMSHIMAPSWAVALVKGWPQEGAGAFGTFTWRAEHPDVLRQVVWLAHRLDLDAAAELAAAAGAVVRLQGAEGVRALLARTPTSAGA